MIYLKFAIIAVVSYLLGSCNFSIILSKILAKKDIRESGSGNAGATNMLRIYGKKYAALTMILDILKVALSIIIAFLLLSAPLSYIFAKPADIELINEYMLYKEFAGFFCVMGHIFPLFFKFKGGKGMAVCTGMVILVDWRIALILFVIFVTVILISKWVSLGSIVIALCYPILIYLFYRDLLLVVTAVLFTATVIIAHRKNIVRIFNGSESKISLGAKKKDGE